MEIDKNLKNELLSLNDETLKNLVNTVAKSAGINMSKSAIGKSDIEKIRSVISNATNKDAQEALKILGGKENAENIINKLKNTGNV